MLYFLEGSRLLIPSRSKYYGAKFSGAHSFPDAYFTFLRRAGSASFKAHEECSSSRGQNLFRQLMLRSVLDEGLF